MGATQGFPHVTHHDEVEHQHSYNVTGSAKIHRVVVQYWKYHVAHKKYRTLRSSRKMCFQLSTEYNSAVHLHHTLVAISSCLESCDVVQYAGASATRGTSLHTAIHRVVYPMVTDLPHTRLIPTQLMEREFVCLDHHYSANGRYSSHVETQVMQLSHIDEHLCGTSIH